MFNLRQGVAARLLIVALTAGMAAGFSACGGGDDDGGDVEPTSEREVSSSPGADNDPTAQPSETLEVNKSLWHSGLKVTVNEATFEPSSFGDGGSVLLEVVFENLGVDTASFQSMAVLQAGGESYEDGGLEQDTPNVPAGLTSNGVLAFDVDAPVELEDAVLVVGNPANNQATIALGVDDSDDVTLEPLEVDVSGSVTAGAVTLNVERAELRADIPEKHDVIEKGSLALTIYFSATVASGIPIGEGVLQSPNVALKLPDGTAVAVRSDGISGVNELLQGKEGTTIRNLKVRFEIPFADLEGEYAFVLRGRYSAEGQVEGELPFTIDLSGSSTPEAANTASNSDATRQTAATEPAEEASPAP